MSLSGLRNYAKASPDPQLHKMCSCIPIKIVKPEMLRMSRESCRDGANFNAGQVRLKCALCMSSPARSRLGREILRGGRSDATITYRGHSAATPLSLPSLGALETRSDSGGANHTQIIDDDRCQNIRF
jgi:hypothetical protein